MTAHVIDGRSYANDLRDVLRTEVASLEGLGIQPGLATILVGDCYSAQVYERRVRRVAEQLGVLYRHEALPYHSSEADVVGVIGKFGADPRISGILLLRPLPPHVSEAAVYRSLDPAKDIEAVHPVNAGLLALGRPRFIPSTPASVFYLLDRYLTESGHDPAVVYEKSDVVIVGRSANVGKPAITLAMERGATVASCDIHSYTANLLYRHTAIADILVVAAGVPNLVSGAHVKQGALAVDVGINPVADPDSGERRLVGDLDFDSVAAHASAITPVPGGVGPITDVWLLHNTITAARLMHATAPTRSLLNGLARPHFDHKRPHDDELIDAIFAAG